MGGKSAPESEIWVVFEGKKVRQNYKFYNYLQHLKKSQPAEKGITSAGRLSKPPGYLIN